MLGDAAEELSAPFSGLSNGSMLLAVFPIAENVGKSFLSLNRVIKQGLIAEDLCPRQFGLKQGRYSQHAVI